MNVAAVDTAGAEAPEHRPTGGAGVGSSGDTRPTGDAATTVAGEVTGAVGRPRGPRPRVTRGRPITGYSDGQLASLLRWIESDTLLRTEEQLLGEFMSELGFQRRGGRIVEAFHRALRRARSSSQATR